MAFNNAMPEVTHFMNASQHQSFVDAEIYRIRLDVVRVPRLNNIFGIAWLVKKGL
jgi:hypothetical protein